MTHLRNMAAFSSSADGPPVACFLSDEPLEICMT
jgi:hypothetical protein